MLASGRRLDVSELLDMPDASGDELQRSLTDLETANRLLGGRTAIFRHIRPFLQDGVSFLDIGCGGADLARWIAAAAGVSVVGLDRSYEVVRIARERTQGFPNLEVIEGDALSLPFDESSFDVVFSSTFLHHLDPEPAVRALAEMRRVARRRVVVSDLVRGWIGSWGVRVVGTVMFGRMSRVDGPRSFQRAYSPAELLDMAGHAGFVRPKVFDGPVRMVMVADL